MSEFGNNKESCFESYIKIDRVKYIGIMHCETAKLRNCETAKLRNCETAKLRNCETAKLRNCGYFRKLIHGKSIAFFWLLFSTLVHATSGTLNVEFKASINSPNKNTFTDTTICTGLTCEPGLNLYKGVNVPGVLAEKYYDYSSPDPERNTVSMTFDGLPKTVTLTDPATGQSISAVFRLAYFGAQLNRLDASSGDMSDTFWSVTNPKGGCHGRSTVVDESFVRPRLEIPESKLTCYGKLMDVFQGKINVSSVVMGYTSLVITPEPLNIYEGTYEGDLVYRFGDNGDIDFHADTNLESEIRIHIKATVEHELYIKFAPGSENVSLGAQGGWEPWINGGHIPPSLSKEVPFSLSSSSGFSVKMQCGHDGGNQNCGLQNTQTGQIVPLEVSMTLPGYKSNGADVYYMSITSAASGYKIDVPGRFITYRRSHVDFRVLRPAVETMVKAPGSTWKGSVTLVFDAQTQ